MAEFPNRRFNRIENELKRQYRFAKFDLMQMKVRYTDQLENGVTEAPRVGAHIRRIIASLEDYLLLLRCDLRYFLNKKLRKLPTYITATADLNDFFFEYDLFEVYGVNLEEDYLDFDHSETMKKMRRKLLAMLRLILKDLKVIFEVEDVPNAEVITVVQPGTQNHLTKFQEEQKFQLDLANKFLKRIQMMAIIVRRVFEGEDDPDDNGS